MPARGMLRSRRARWLDLMTVKPSLVSTLSLLVVAISICLTGGCSRSHEAQLQPSEIARVAGSPISQENFQALLNLRAGGNTNLYATTEAKAALLDELIRREAILARARAAGFDQRPDIQESVRRMIAGKFQEEQMRALETNEITVSDQEVEQYYRDHAEKYSVPAKARGAIIFIRIPPTASQEKRRELAARAESLLEQAKTATAAEFSRLVIDNSEDQATRYRSGDIGWFSSKTGVAWVDPAVTKALLDIGAAGGFAPVITTPRGLYIARQTDFKPAGLRPLSEVKDGIAYVLQKQARDRREQGFYAEMKAGLDIQINSQLLDSMRASPAIPAPLPVTPGSIAEK